MVRDFEGGDLDEDELVAMCEEALRAPTAGHARGVELVVLSGADGVERYLGAATDATWRRTSARYDGLARAGGAVVVVVDPGAYARRYAAPDKAASGLDGPAAWPVPYWHGDAGAAVMALLLLATDRGLGACFLGAFRNAAAVLDLVGAPPAKACYGAVLLGRASSGDVPSASLARPGPSRAERVLRARYERDAR